MLPTFSVSAICYPAVCYLLYWCIYTQNETCQSRTSAVCYLLFVAYIHLLYVTYFFGVHTPRSAEDILEAVLYVTYFFGVHTPLGYMLLLSL